MLVADKIAEWLHEKGIAHAFGIIGAGNIALWNAIALLQKTRLISCHHEQACVMAAGAYYRISGRISVALVTTGAGSTNAVTGVASAWMDSVPVLILSGNEASKYLDAPTRVLGVQGYNSTKLAHDICKVVSRPWPENIIGQLEHCLEQALKPRQGPCWLDVPKDYQNATV